MIQRRATRRPGLKAGCYIAATRLALAGFDQALWQAKRFHQKNHIGSSPASTRTSRPALWASQQIPFIPAPATRLFGMLYGQGPGVDRSAIA